eukprot:296913-Chlamydomonas_euryale.AAC.9
MLVVIAAPHSHVPRRCGTREEDALHPAYPRWSTLLPEHMRDSHCQVRTPVDILTRQEKNNVIFPTPTSFMQSRPALLPATATGKI